MSILWPPRASGEVNYISGPPALELANRSRRRLVILGSTGSIGQNALHVVAASGSLEIAGLACARNIELLATQALQWRPPFLAVLTEELGAKLQERLPGDYRPQILHGSAGFARLASLPVVDMVLSAQAGSSGLAGTLAAALSGKVIALANKESLVMAGGLLRQICARTRAAILPVDSEHYALFQCLAGNPGKEIARLILTASGGPFLGKSRAELAHMTSKDALRHPTWSMGAKISIDSATLMNKGLEVIEAMHLFGVTVEKLKVLIHPQSIVHSLAQFQDASILGQLACPDMRLPIGACLMWPERVQPHIPALDLAQTAAITFMEPDMEAFPCLALAMRAAAWQPDPAWRKLGLNPACIILNAANEAGVNKFLNGEIGFLEIASFVEAALEGVMSSCPAPPGLEMEGCPAKAAVEASRAIAGFAGELLLS